MIWALQTFKRLEADPASVRKLFDLPAVPYARALAHAALDKHYKVYCFDRDGQSHDISHLDPAAERTDESEWGGLAGFASTANAEVVRVAHAAEARARRERRQPQ